MATIIEREISTGQKRYRVQIRRKGLPRFSLTFNTIGAAREWISNHEMQYCENPDFYKYWAKSQRLHQRRLREMAMC